MRKMLAMLMLGAAVVLPGVAAFANDTSGAIHAQYGGGQQIDQSNTGPGIDPGPTDPYRRLSGGEGSNR